MKWAYKETIQVHRAQEQKQKWNRQGKILEKDIVTNVTCMKRMKAQRGVSKKDQEEDYDDDDDAIIIIVEKV